MLCFQVKMNSSNSSKFVPLDAEWTYVRNPTVHTDNFELRGLEPETAYQLMMRVQNRLGWSDYSSSNFVFHTPRGSLLLTDCSRLIDDSIRCYPTSITALTSLPSFKRQLKTFLFTKSFPSVSFFSL